MCWPVGAHMFALVFCYHLIYTAMGVSPVELSDVDMSESHIMAALLINLQQQLQVMYQKDEKCMGHCTRSGSSNLMEGITSRQIAFVREGRISDIRQVWFAGYTDIQGVVLYAIRIPC